MCLDPIWFASKKGNSRENGNLKDGADPATRIPVFDPAQERSRDASAVGHLLCAHLALDPADANHLGQHFKGFEIMAGKGAICWFCHCVTLDINVPSRHLLEHLYPKYGVETNDQKRTISIGIAQVSTTILIRFPP
ncbi:MAG: hypothetical protein WCF54_16565 [Terracidiphilus sp.]